MADDEKAQSGDGDIKQGIIPRRIYLKDASFESPNTPDVFLRKWKPTLELEIENKSAEFDNGTHEIVLTVSVRAILDNKTAYMAEVYQCGLFALSGFDEAGLKRATDIHCLRILYPYATAALADLVSKGGFPQLLLRPVNFNTLYEKRQQIDQEQEDTVGTTQDG